MKIGNYIFRQTCAACPEQYDVFDETGKQVAYIRLRWGGLTASCPDVGCSIVYSADIGDGMTGCFTSAKERAYHLRKIAERIEWFFTEIRCPHCEELYLPTDEDFDEIEDYGKFVVDCGMCDRLFVVGEDGDGLYVKPPRR